MDKNKCATFRFDTTLLVQSPPFCGSIMVPKIVNFACRSRILSKSLVILFQVIASIGHSSISSSILVDHASVRTQAKLLYFFLIGQRGGLWMSEGKGSFYYFETHEKMKIVERKGKLAVGRNVSCKVGNRRFSPHKLSTCCNTSQFMVSVLATVHYSLPPKYKIGPDCFERVNSCFGFHAATLPAFGKHPRLCTSSL
jgi:hypothetical protein